MYKKHKVMLFMFSIVVAAVFALLDLHINSIASDVISVVSISSALYLAAYAGIQASVHLKEKLKEPDSILKHRTQRVVLNSYIKTALVLNVITIVFVCVNSVVADRVMQFEAQSGSCVIKQFMEYISKQPVQKETVPSIWLWVKRVLNLMSTALFVANLIQMCFIGKFVTNRILFDE